MNMTNRLSLLHLQHPSKFITSNFQQNCISEHFLFLGSFCDVISFYFLFPNVGIGIQSSIDSCLFFLLSVILPSSQCTHAAYCQYSDSLFPQKLIADHTKVFIFVYIFSFLYRSFSTNKNFDSSFIAMTIKYEQTNFNTYLKMNLMLLLAMIGNIT